MLFCITLAALIATSFLTTGCLSKQLSEFVPIEIFSQELSRLSPLRCLTTIPSSNILSPNFW